MTLYDFEDLVERGLHVVQPDVAFCGGLTVCRDMGRLCAEQGRRAVPHCFSTGINLAASLHWAASMDNGDLVEYCLRPSPLMRRLVPNLPRWSTAAFPFPTLPASAWNSTRTSSPSSWSLATTSLPARPSPGPTPRTARACPDPAAPREGQLDLLDPSPHRAPKPVQSLSPGSTNLRASPTPNTVGCPRRPSWVGPKHRWPVHRPGFGHLSDQVGIEHRMVGPGPASTPRSHRLPTASSSLDTPPDTGFHVRGRFGGTDHHGTGAAAASANTASSGRMTTSTSSTDG
ncbi:MAG: hypothetical protein Ct9H300mP1_06700 [Planctomycetaceae bacterium]|nr:MAG: hypothetical protein Ct9H300mP1_06700 [Planctomycetaceae bacterium]